MALLMCVDVSEAPGDSFISVDDLDYTTPGYSRQNLEKFGSSTVFQKEGKLRSLQASGRF
jgi:hypothetical protein